MSEVLRDFRTLKKRVAASKKLYLKTMPSTFGAVSPTCRAIGINPRTFYFWCKSDPEFVSRVADKKRECIDSVVGKLADQISEGNITAIIFFLKTQSRHEWGERVEVTGSIEHTHRIAQIASEIPIEARAKLLAIAYENMRPKLAKAIGSDHA